MIPGYPSIDVIITGKNPDNKRTFQLEFKPPVFVYLAPLILVPCEVETWHPTRTSPCRIQVNMRTKIWWTPRPGFGLLKVNKCPQSSCICDSSMLGKSSKNILLKWWCLWWWVRHLFNGIIFGHVKWYHVVWLVGGWTCASQIGNHFPNAFDAKHFNKKNTT